MTTRKREDVLEPYQRVEQVVPRCHTLPDSLLGGDSTSKDQRSNFIGLFLFAVRSRLMVTRPEGKTTALCCLRTTVTSLSHALYVEIPVAAELISQRQLLAQQSTGILTS